MHPMTTHHLAMDNQRRLLDQAAADRLARAATADRGSVVSRLAAALGRRQPRPAVRHAEPRTARTGQA
jgi:hypothetical protein